MRSRQMSATRAFRAAAIAWLSLVGSIALLALIAPNARAGFNVPSFIRQWSTGAGSEMDVTGIDVDRSGNVYALRYGGG